MSKRKPDALIPRMAMAEFKMAFDKLGFSPAGLARFVGRDDRTVRRWLTGAPIQAELALMLRLMVRFKVEPPSASRRKEQH